MEGNGWRDRADLRFGVAIRDGEEDWTGIMSSHPELGTVELPFDRWTGGGIQASGDLCIRLGASFILPALDMAAEGGVGKGEAAYRAAVKAVRAGQGPQPSAFLLEFPANVTHSAAARRHLDRLIKDMEGLPLAVAFHGADWYSARVIEGLKARGVALCLLDGAGEPGSPPSIDVVTSSLVYIRLRGDTDPSAWLARIEALAAQAGTLRVIFSGSEAGASAQKAAIMARLWQARTGSG